MLPSSRFIILILFFKLNTVWADDTDELMPADVARQIKECADACQGYRKTLFNFMTEMNTTSYELAQKEFFTCQTKCPRCSLQNAADAMGSIQEFSPAFSIENRGYIRWKQTNIIPSIELCVSQWNRSAIFGCDRNPVELYTSDCILG
ncbi:uncharacterized protein EV154DRAFT_481067 [Mucor mucedo]|uniref:uncharacterized protein n=1 Tax=Mucor mucedo TaxID=29922 RepID=UPI00221E565E|nr:uncharacterized protein EV154DRAFT_481067 [Mucor mucedo]KAI7891635.1 hypothetical protein EV154DRAFT_481067 [Mucor mucedo]